MNFDIVGIFYWGGDTLVPVFLKCIRRGQESQKDAQSCVSTDYEFFVETDDYPSSQGFKVVKRVLKRTHTMEGLGWKLCGLGNVGKAEIDHAFEAIHFVNGDVDGLSGGVAILLSASNDRTFIHAYLVEVVGEG